MTQGHLCSLLGMNAGRFSTLKGGRRVPDAMATEYAALLSSWLDDPDFRVCDAREPLQKRPRQATAGAGSSSDGAAEEAPPKRARPAGESPPCGPAEAEPRARRSATKAADSLSGLHAQAALVAQLQVLRERDRDSLLSRKERRGEHLPDRERGGERGRL